MNELLLGEESLSAGVRRVASAEADRAIRAIRAIDGEADPHAAVHEVRKSCKKVRAALRLVRDAVGPECYHRENARFRDAARRISELRDRQVALETFTASAADLPLTPDQRERIRSALVERRDEALGEGARMRLLDHVATILHEGQIRIHDWPIPDEGFQTIGAGLRRVYRRGRKGYRRAHRSRSTADLHDWRKRAKYLRYQVRMLRPVWPGTMRALASTLHELTDALGTDHDLATLLDTLIDTGFLRPDSVEGQRVRARVVELRSREQHAAWMAGRRAYAERPAQFVHRIARYWEAASGGPMEPPAPA